MLTVLRNIRWTKVLWWVEDDLSGRQPWWKTTSVGRPLVEDDLRWKMTFGGRRPSVEVNLRWKTTYAGWRPSVEDDPCMLLSPLCCIFGIMTSQYSQSIIEYCHLLSIDIRYFPIFCLKVFQVYLMGFLCSKVAPISGFVCPFCVFRVCVQNYFRPPLGRVGGWLYSQI